MLAAEEGEAISGERRERHNDVGFIFEQTRLVKLLSDDALYSRPAHVAVDLGLFRGAYVVLKRDRIIGTDAAGVEAIFERLMQVPDSDTILKPIAVKVDSSLMQLRLVLPFLASAQTVCLDLIRFVFPTGRAHDSVPLTVEELRLFVLDMGEALSTLHAHGVTRSSVEPANIFVEFEAATHSTRRRVMRFVLADFRRIRQYRSPEEAQRIAVIDALHLPVKVNPPKRDDVYDFGACLLWLITRNAELLHPTDQVAHDVAPFVGLAQRCMQAEVARRPSVLDVASALVASTNSATDTATLSASWTTFSDHFPDL